MEGKSISLSSDSPRWAVVPSNIMWVTLAKFDITSNWDDTLVKWLTFARSWLWDKDDISEIAVYTDE